MAKRHVLLRFAQAENEYLEMLSLLNELKDDVENNRIDQDYYNEKVELLSDEIEAIKTQYFFWAETIYELNKPNRKSKELTAEEQSWFKVLQSKTKNVLLDESKDALATLKELLNKGEI